MKLRSDARPVSLRCVASTVVVAWVLIVIAPVVQAQSLNTLHSFGGGADGRSSQAGLTMDRARNFYGNALQLPRRLAGKGLGR
jgi:hypothetical protein